MAGTREPSASAPRFVVQQHAASTLHYDFRLEVGGVLKSWAIRKGPSLNPKEKRLAKAVDDHALGYGDFEGVLPSGYGAGAVIVWDRGTYRNLRAAEGVSMEDALAEGKVTIWLDGEKLKGGYTLVEMKGRDGWLLIKRDDEHADPERDLVAEAPASVLSGRTVEDLGGPVSPRSAPRRARTSAPKPSATERKARPKPPLADAPPVTVEIEGQAVELTHLDRVLFPDAGLTKGDLVDYYRRIARWMLPYLEGRPLVLQRFPGGIGAPGFVQQHTPAHYPDWVDRATVEKEGGEVVHAVVNHAAALVYLANQGVITPHVWLSRVDALECPDRLIFDLDPEGNDFDLVRQAAYAVRALLDELGLPAFVMTTGSSGLHVVTPLDRSADFDAVRRFARRATRLLEKRHPDLLTTEQRKAGRGGRVFLDVLRNSYAHTAVPPFAVRALPGAPVATPLAWEELDAPELDARRYTIQNIFARLDAQPDPWQALAHRATSLDAAQKRLETLQRRARKKTAR